MLIEATTRKGIADQKLFRSFKVLRRSDLVGRFEPEVGRDGH
jgi:hypothetical protein